MIISRTPFRISFVGGGSDLPAFCERSPGAVLSVTINKAMYLTLHPYFDRGKTLLRYSKTELADSLDEIKHPIFREALRLTGMKGGVEISSTADVPSGTGMGSSSSFTVGLLHVLSAYQARYASKEYLGATASHLEIDVLKEPIGRQDQYAAAYGGLNVIEFHANGGVRVAPVTISNDLLAELDNRLLMFYTGQQRATRSILSDQGKRVATEEEKFKSTAKMVELVYQMRDALFARDLHAFGELLHRNWELKRSLSEQISNSAVDDAYDRALKAGASGGKLLGAGGGGFLLLYCEPHDQRRLRDALSDLHEIDFSFSLAGSSIIYTDGYDMDEATGFYSVK
jgi:D-glycero-alpha-D-manno-heptose-7-phosphate kinase